ncbi:predicted protein [Naegleria gruberi]|uniref:Predicted protein n=1 Tax=Naegleria gruberi TaxID=5762 RepID=D2VAA1_NAEGR|nr:uncharacterized protein NAEGRDRAFT_65787 [Naegleria gruberi]EFC46393.1 predicted protein [Naegleria gruberi]|eukprot:XP_002679137.1 predicted protein [Naegleria gruberi strain NEG-M]
MVSNKKILYSVILSLFILEEIFQIVGLGTCICLLLDLEVIYIVVSSSLEQSIFYLSIAACVNCQCFITKILNQLFFNKSHEWMRMNKKRHYISRFITILSISLIVTVNLIFVIIVGFVISSNIFRYYDADRKLLSETDFLIFKQVGEAMFGLYISITSLVTIYYSLLNMAIVVLLIRKLLLNQKFPITEQRKKSCRNLLLLTFGQLYMAIFNLISLIVGSAAFGIFIQIYPVCILFHKITLLSFCVFVTFSFGPLDNIMIEIRASSNDTVETIKRDAKSQAAVNTVDIVRKEEFRVDSIKSEISHWTPSIRNETPILIDPTNEFTEIPLWETPNRNQF